MCYIISTTELYDLLVYNTIILYFTRFVRRFVVVIITRIVISIKNAVYYK